MQTTTTLENNIKRLDMSHWNDIEELYHACDQGIKDRFTAKGTPITDDSSMRRVWEIWQAGIKRYYLNNDNDHFLYGIWGNGKLQTMLGWRCDLPEPYNNDWVIVYMKSRPETNTTGTYLAPLWRLMFDQCETRGLQRWHAIVSKDRHTKFDAFERKFTADIHSRYKYETLVDIPPGVQPDIEWVWAMMGRHLLRTHQEVRTGTRIK